VDTVSAVGQVRLTLDNELHKLNLLEKTFLDDLDCFNIGHYHSKDKLIYTHNLDDNPMFYVSTSTLSKNPKIENSISEYVKNHMYDMLQENNYNLFLSGGIDSENIGNIFIEHGINFTPVIVSYKHKDKILNDYDIKYAFKFCSKHNITPKIIDIDIIDFFSTGKFRKYAFDYGCNSPQFTPILNAFEKIDGNIIYSGHQKIFTNIFHNCRQTKQDIYSIVENYSFNGEVKNDINFMEKSQPFFVFDKFLKDRNDESISDFYAYNTDMCLTATNNLLKKTPITYEELIKYTSWSMDGNNLSWAQEYKDSADGIVNIRSTKYRNLKKSKYNFKYNYFYKPNNLNATPRPKYTGFEGVKKFYSDKYIGKDLLLKEFDKHFRQTLTRAVVIKRNAPDVVVNYILREK